MNEIEALADLVRTIASTLRRRIVMDGIVWKQELAMICDELDTIARQLDGFVGANR